PDANTHGIAPRAHQGHAFDGIEPVQRELSARGGNRPRLGDEQLHLRDAAGRHLFVTDFQRHARERRRRLGRLGLAGRRLANGLAALGGEARRTYEERRRERDGRNSVHHVSAPPVIVVGWRRGIAASPNRRAPHRRRLSPSLARESSYREGTEPSKRTEVQPADPLMRCARGWCHRLQRSTHHTGRRRGKAATRACRGPARDPPMVSALRALPRGRPVGRGRPAAISAQGPRPSSQSAPRRRAWPRSAAAGAPTTTAVWPGREPDDWPADRRAVARSPSGCRRVRPETPASSTPPSGPTLPGNGDTRRGARDPRQTRCRPAVPAEGSRLLPGVSGPTVRDWRLDSRLLLAACFWLLSETAQAGVAEQENSAEGRMVP